MSKLSMIMRNGRLQESSHKRDNLTEWVKQQKHKINMLSHYQNQVQLSKQK